MSDTTTQPAGTDPRPIHVIASEIRTEWKNVYFGAAPYLEAMTSLTRIDDAYGLDTAEDIVRRFLVNAQYFRGAKARQLKEELRAMLPKNRS